ncbi:MAG: aspartate carbamoyltransferase [Desulfurococcales archaeon]|nr:aspartate carbamoyltransferase [Desulfurococcales archaeon]
MHGSWKGRDVISILDFSLDDLEELYNQADKYLEKIRAGTPLRTLEGLVISLAFFEPSTRTRMSFETAAKRLGANVIGFTAAAGTSLEKGESYADTIRMLDGYSDLIVLRHKYEGAARFAAEIAEHPVVNGGDGKQHHPTQAFIDLYTIRKLKQRLEGLNIGVLGDLRYGRAANSFILGTAFYRTNTLYLISPSQLRMRDETRIILEDLGVRFYETESLEDVVSDLDVLYVTRIQKERFPDPSEYEKVKGSYRVTRRLLETRAKPDLIVMHPLPRVGEISYDVDDTRYQAYFKQAYYGVPVRMAVLSLVLGREG